MKTELLRTSLAILLLTTQAVAAAPPSEEILDTREAALGTAAHSDRRAHQLLERPEQGFSYPTLIFGLEKTSRRLLRSDGPGGGFRSAEEAELLERLGPPTDCPPEKRSKSCDRRRKMIEQQRSKLAGYLDAGDRTFVSHVLFYDRPEPTSPEVVHSAYVDCGQNTGGLYDCNASPYANSWRAFDRLDAFLHDRTATDESFTHILLLSMGWNTSQTESVVSFQEITGHLAREAEMARVRFRPLIVGLTWHSGWHWGLGDIPLLDLVPRAASYATKAKDADEIGVTWANALLHRVLLPLGAEMDLPVAAIGHSFGARILTRAAASGHLLDAEPKRPLALLVALQGAFSLNRFLAERCAGREGAPYFHLSETVDRVALVWSRSDRTNPLANLFSGANHVGAKPAYRRALAYPKRFDFATWDPNTRTLLTVEPEPKKEGTPCGGDFPQVEAVELIEATTSVSRHGDVENEKVGALLWTLLSKL